MKAHELLSSPERWIKHAFALDNEGYTVSSCSELAACWCIGGAIIHCYPYQDKQEEITAKLTFHLNVVDITGWNDTPERTYKEVITLLKKLDI